MKRIQHNQRGFSVIMAIILVVLFALLGTYMSTLSNTSSLNTTQSYRSMQAWMAAKSGFQWGVQQVTTLNACFPAADADFGDTGDGSFTLAGGSTNGFRVLLTCVATPITEGGVFYNVYNLTSTASTGTLGEITYVSRVINASVTDAL